MSFAHINSKRTQRQASGRCAGQLYQLLSRREHAPGTYVAVNGPWDTYGVIRTSTEQADGQFLNLIRGVPARPGERPVVQF